jgi:hypothetical protein
MVLVFDIVVCFCSGPFILLVIYPLVLVDSDCKQGNAQSETSVVRVVHASKFNLKRPERCLLCSSEM